jgi:hypothetical protein
MKKFTDVNPFAPEEEIGASPKKSYFKKLKELLKIPCFEKYPKTWQGWLVLLAVLFLLWQFLVSWGILPSLTFPAVDKDKWQTVFLTNGQVYFGHLREANKNYAILKNIYYLQVSQQLQPPDEQSQQQINLVKLGNELHGPEDKMYIPKNQIIFWENMKDESPISRAIKQMQ